jgi:hypothetical protein
MADAAPAEKPLCFVIGPIGKAGSADRKHADFLLKGIIRPALSSEEAGYVVKRADEDADPGMITDRIISDIINADLVVADLTGLNANVFYELGIRHSVPKPVIHIAKANTPLPFDNAMHRVIFVDISDWTDVEGARCRLADSARAIKAPDYRVSNPVTHALGNFKMRASGDPSEKLLADMVERFASLEAREARYATLERAVEAAERQARYWGALAQQSTVNNALLQARHLDSLSTPLEPGEGE